MEKIKLSETSALVMNWLGKDIYQEYNTKKYLEMLDIDSGKYFAYECNKIWENYDQVIKNRKFCISSIIQNYIISGFKQIIILAAGLDPLSVNLASKYSDIRIFDIDVSNMEKKKELCFNVSQDLLNKIFFITADITNLNEIFEKLSENEFDNSKPTIIIAEGISYYIKKSDLENLINLFSKETKNNRFVLEYLVQTQNIISQKRHIPEKVFDLIAKECDLKQIKRYDIKSINQVLEKVDGKIIEHFTMNQMEKIRLKKNLFFNSKKDGWIEICVCSI